MIKSCAFTLVQAFFLGYYYGVFFALVDTSTLRHQVIEGAWGFRSTHLFEIAQDGLSNPGDESRSSTRTISRADLSSILSGFSLGNHINLQLSEARFRNGGYAVQISSVLSKNELFCWVLASTFPTLLDLYYWMSTLAGFLEILAV